MLASRYTIQRQRLEPEERLRLFRELIRWSAPRSDRFLVSMFLPDYEDADQVERVRRLGVVIDDQAFRTVRRMISPPHDPDDRLVRVTGFPGEDFVEEITTHTAPAGAISGDDSPVEDLWLYRGNRELYVLGDYGRDSVVEVEGDEEEQALQQILSSVGLGPDALYRHDRQVSG